MTRSTGVALCLRAQRVTGRHAGLGHTDDSGAAAHDQTRSQGRADATKAYLVGAGIAADRLTALAFGATKPLAPNDSETHRAQTRRVQIIKR
ncbi:OmpA family protein [Ralstonia soli]|uniref:OmpA family protein n=1 Tax=Ralstonia soli TaxID=2953896 RepID=A0ABT1AEP1_9RALS|nr:OmpA family protein [Ralstonia soli]MCO5396854.1 OmpA family protein [Ralstonia soli]